MFVFVRAAWDLATPDGIVPFVVVASFGAYIVVAEAVLARARTRRGPTTQLATGFAQWVPAFAWVPYGVVALHIGPEVALPEPIGWLGVALTVAGIGFALWALFAIGRHFDLQLETHRDHEVVRRGPYRFVRHPIYTGLAAHTIGACLATGNLPLVVGTLLVTFPVLFVRARTEERLLRRELGSDYDEYAREVGMLVPFVGRT